MTTLSSILQPGTLGQRVQERTDSALKSGALLPIPTQAEVVVQAGVPFLVRIVSNLARKERAKRRQDRASTGNPINPFLPYEETLFVADLSPTHVCLLNKYNVVDYHLLLITRAFEDQESLLSLADFQALWRCLEEIDGLGFYNSGKLAGASQPHKHLQLVPLPLMDQGEAVPIAPLLHQAVFSADGIGTLPAFEFVHGLMRFDAGSLACPDRPEALLTAYLQLLQSMGLLDQNQDRPVAAYNLLVTRRWMLLIPRSQETCHGISINALGFAGAILLRTPEPLEILKQVGPLTVLQQVAIAGSARIGCDREG